MKITWERDLYTLTSIKWVSSSIYCFLCQSQKEYISIIKWTTNSVQRGNSLIRKDCIIGSNYNFADFVHVDSPSSLRIIYPSYTHPCKPRGRSRG